MNEDQGIAVLTALGLDNAWETCLPMKTFAFPMNLAQIDVDNWKADLHNLLGFLSLRADSHAQYEIRAYADAMLDTVRAWVPETFQAFRDYRMGAVTLSAPALATVRRLLAGEPVDQPGSGLSKREWAELMDALRRA